MPDTDTRPRAPLNGKSVRLCQLAAEVGTDLTASDTEVVVAAADSTVTQSALQKALDAHMPAPDVDHDADFRSAVDAATDLEGLKAALLGMAGPGAEPRRPAAS